MKKNDYDFIKNCQSLDIEIKRLVKTGSLKNAIMLKNNIVKAIKDWKDVSVQANRRILSLKRLLSSTEKEINKIK